MTGDGRAHGKLARYKHGPSEDGQLGTGCRCGPCRAANSTWQRNQYRMAAYGRWDGWADATGTQRRLQALMWNGWSLGLLSDRLGCTRQALRTKLLSRAKAMPATVTAVRVLYDELWDQVPPERTSAEKRAATMARQYARDHGWVPPLAWDAIDDPAAVPVPGWERDGRRQWGTLAEDAADLISFGESIDGAAERLGVSRNTLTTTLARARGRKERAATGAQDAA